MGQQLVLRTTPQYFEAEGGLTVTNLGGSNVTYTTTWGAAAEGTLTPGQNTWITTAKWFQSLGKSHIFLDRESELEPWVDSGAVDTIQGDALLTPDSDTENGYVVKSPSATWGTGAYGTGDAFILLREDYTGGAEAEPDRNVLFRVDGHDGGIGTTAGLHVATGLRKHSGDTFTQSIWIDPTDDVVGLVIDAADAAQTADFLRVRSPAGVNKLVIDKDGDLIWGSGSGDTILYRSAAGTLKTDGSAIVVGDVAVRLGVATQVFIGDALFGGTKAGISFGSSSDVNLYRDAADTLKTDDKLHVAGELELDGALNHDGSTVGFYGTAPVAQQTGVAVTAAGVHAALVNLGLITA